jgi:hypothetical protein
VKVIERRQTWRTSVLVHSSTTDQPTPTQHDVAKKAEHHEHLRARLHDAEQQLAHAHRNFAPHRRGLDAADAAVHSAQERIWAANNTAPRTKGRTRRAAVRDGRAARLEHAEALEHEATHSRRLVRSTRARGI